MLSVAKYLKSRGGRFSNHLSRLRHFRGHGVHSPYVYSIVRNVLMSRRLHGDAAPLFEALNRYGCDRRSSIEISNLVSHCGYYNFDIDRLSESNDVAICTHQMDDHTLQELIRRASKQGATVVILASNKRVQLCETIVKYHRSTTIDRLNYLVILNNHLPKQHFKL
ncbi:MAG: hypothetical protein SNI51_03300 [Rikenellaceae bacterium]